MRIIAHRGAAGLGPENTLLAMRRALDLGVRWLEFDVHAVAGEVVVFHDDRLERTTNGHGRLGEQSLEHLRTLDAGAGERIPLLREVLDLAAGGARLNIELKGAGSALPTLALLERYVAAGRYGWDDFLVSSFDQGELAQARRQRSELPLGLLLAEVTPHYREACEQLGVSSLHLPAAAVDAGLVAQVHALGLQLLVYTVNVPAEAAALAALGVDGVFTDEPHRLLSLTTGR